MASTVSAAGRAAGGVGRAARVRWPRPASARGRDAGRKSARRPVPSRGHLNQRVSASHWPSVSTRVVSVRPFFILTLAVFLPPSSPISAEA
jgi:hypothetical protein